MIRRIQALRYRCLRYVDLDLGRFHVLIGPNASGKSTLFDVVAFVSDLVRDGLESAVEHRTRNFQDMVWNRPDHEPGFELAVEFEIPETLLDRLPGDYRRFRLRDRRRGSRGGRPHSVGTRGPHAERAGRAEAALAVP